MQDYYVACYFASMLYCKLDLMQAINHARMQEIMQDFLLEKLWAPISNRTPNPDSTIKVVLVVVAAAAHRCIGASMQIFYLTGRRDCGRIGQEGGVFLIAVVGEG
ncbi:MAG: hypothetical protein KKF27_20245 [Gammaproteobacteria bacterium]|nr:hypothetical protein [Gammaproteobacteria bacterium]MBU2685578.1 hypothetical protein [Gammaproteobacteria bacterium]